MASNYKLHFSGLIIRLDDGAWIPPTLQNLDWVAYQKWLAAGNVPVAADPAPVPAGKPATSIAAQTALAVVTADVTIPASVKDLLTKIVATLP